ncbi:cytochrome b/b6 domain-containing protein [Pelagibacterium sp. 26DY04]|uniref:cytochrome b/b6 domain-containing protein n=1 Tax=Pelagibacterium sp. 26DY04 TaxID=2967130 RepID=UPI002814E357|nr:cytochrome b/b6 domain-containing protein [Pelagibacterium sp. 26DY04]WMT88899.1 cytochrome b/b6 domain-containing protein [Pelagibacterium sp. 26DY04]
MERVATRDVDTGAEPRPIVIKRQSIWTRLTHWVWVICLFFLLLTGLQIFNAHPSLYIGQQSGFEFSNSVFSISAQYKPDGSIGGYTTIFGNTFETTGVFGYSGPEGQERVRAFPAWLTIPSYQDLATGRVVHFFFGWLLVATMFVWFLASFINGHLRRDIIPSGADIRSLPRDVAAHARLRFHHTRHYNVLQKLSYGIVLLILFPLIVLTGLTMSPGMDVAWPWLVDLFGGRQTARTIHFIVMVLLVGFFIIHIVMVLLAGPINTMRSMITGRYRIDPEPEAEQ